MEEHVTAEICLAQTPLQESIVGKVDYFVQVLRDVGSGVSLILAHEVRIKWAAREHSMYVW